MTENPRFLRLVGIILVAVALLLGTYTLVAYLGWQSGQSLRVQRIEEERTQELNEQMTRARQEIGDGNFRLAQRRLEWVLEQDPEHAEAQELLEQVSGGLSGTRSPDSDQAAADPNATATVAVTATVESNQQESEQDRSLRQLQQMVEEEAWEDALTAIITFQNQHPEYERQETDRLLYDAYIGQGVELLYGEQVELGLYYLSQAEALGNLPQDVLDQKHWAELYLAGIGYYGVNWDVSLFYFRDLCAAAPFFHDSCQKFYESAVAFGDQYAFQQEWCPAEELYAEAYRVNDTNDVSRKLNEARQSCAGATPTASAPITGTVPVEEQPTAQSFAGEQ
jgi:hypothetical protein